MTLSTPLKWASIMLVFLLLSAPLLAQKKKRPVRLSERTFGAIEARHIGPATMSGRIAALDAVNRDPRILYVGAAGGGVWKSKNGGTTFKHIFEKHPQAIGAVTIDQKHPDTVWVGTGEPWTRNSTSVGKGVYKTTDGGDKWKLMGLENTERIGKILVHPDNSNVVYVAALGHLWGANEDRGLYRTEDGGKNWEKILYVDENTGCSSIAFDPNDPNIMYAGMWDFRRTAYDFRSGGPGSGLHKSTDGGKTWKKLTKDLPKGTIGRIALAVSPVEPYYLYATVEAKKSALYRSVDQGESWEKVNESATVGERPFYFSLIVADPVDSARVWKPGFTLNVSNNAGKSFGSPSFEGGRTHSDHHALWIDPSDNDHLYLGTDGGVYISNDQGNTWSIVRSLPVSQFYHVSADNEQPYNVYGGLQDNGSWMAPSQSTGGISNANWRSVGFGDGFVVLRDPTDPNIMYWESQGGNVVRYYLNSEERKSIRPYSESSTDQLRFNWDTPIYFGHEATPALYVGAQFLFRSKDRGDSWEKISPDLTTNDPLKQQQEKSGGLTIDNSTAENHCSIITISESPQDPNVIWVGTDDGNVQVTKNGGKSWTNVVGNMADVPANTWVSYVEASRTAAGTAYVTLEGHRNDDKNPYIFKTTDFGATWTALATDKIKSFCHVIKEDPVNPNLLFLGTEMGLYLSIDAGKNWVRFNGNVPQTPVMDLMIHPREHDLIIATHGRGIMIVDDLTPLRAITEEVIQQDVAFLDSKPFVLRPAGGIQRFPGDDEFSGQNPSSAAVISYYLKKRHIFGDMSMEVYNDKGEKVSTIVAGKRKGVNRVNWIVRKKAPRVPRSKGLSFQAAFGPTLPPGTYTVKLFKGEETYTHTAVLMNDPDSPHSPEDLQANFEAVNRAYDMLEDLAFLSHQVKELMDQSRAKADSLKSKRLVDDLMALSNRMEKERDALVPNSANRIAGQVRLRERLASIYGNVTGYQGRPTQSQLETLDNVEKEMKALEARLQEIHSTELPKLNKQLNKQKLAPIEVTSQEAFEAEGEEGGSQMNWEGFRF